MNDPACNESERESKPQVPRPWQPRFGIGGLMLMMFVFSVMAASAYYFTRFLQRGRESQLAFILFTVAAPLLLVVLMSGGRALLAWLNRR